MVLRQRTTHRTFYNECLLAVQISCRQGLVETWQTALAGRWSMGRLALLTQIVVSLGYKCMMACSRSAMVTFTGLPAVARNVLGVSKVN